MEKNNGEENRTPSRMPGPRHSILDLAPLELECLSALWPLGEATVRDIYLALAASRPRAYTTVMTIMDRLEQKGIVARRKAGRAFHYRARLSAEEARGKAVEKIVDGFFAGSREALAAHLSAEMGVAGVRDPLRARPVDRHAQTYEPAAGNAAAAAVASEVRPVTPGVDAPVTSDAESAAQNLDETLL